MRLGSSSKAPFRVSTQELERWVWSLQTVAAYLRQGDYLPGGGFFEHVVRNR
jgi:hypothetical protein